MGLTTPRGPLGGLQRAGWFAEKVPNDLTYVEPHARRVVAVRRGKVVIDTEQALLVHRPGRHLTWVFPESEVGDLPREPERDAPGFVRVPWDAADEWFEEGRPIRSPYPPNPYHRVDCRPTTRRLTVSIGNLLLVDTDDTTIVFETTFEPRLYVSPSLVRTDLLRPSSTTSWCNYKGQATYWSALLGDQVVDDVAWSYEEPVDESAAIAGFMSFDGDKVQLAADLPVGWRAGRNG